MKYRSTYQNKDGTKSIYEHNKDFYDLYRARYGDTGNFETIETDDPIVPFRRMEVKS